ncbi:hypothetical protein SALBM311S_02206 [Streptomyces alboniger]
MAGPASWPSVLWRRSGHPRLFVGRAGSAQARSGLSARASRSLLRTLITNQAVTRASTAIAAAAMKPVEMPWASTSWPQGAGNCCVLANSAFCSAVPSVRNCGSCFSASSLLAEPNTVVRMDRPSEPPTCCMVLSSPDAAPASCWATPETAVSVSVTKFRPIPKPNTDIGPRTPPT